MTTYTTAPRQRAGTASRRFGYLVALAINAALLYGANCWPGWDAVPFLTQDTPKVLGIVNASLIAGMVANAVYIGWDPPRLKAFGDIVTTAIALVATVRIWQVFPFDFGASGFPWETTARVLLVIAIVGSGLGILVSFVTLVRGGPDRG